MLTLLQNPFNLTRDREEIEHAEGETVAEVLQRRGLDGRYQVVCNGELLPPECGMAHAIGDDDDVHVFVVLENAALKTIALIGVMAATAFFTAGLGNIIGGVLFTSLTTAAQNAIAATILSVGGSLLVQGVASLFETKPGGSNYGVLGPQMTARSGIPIPKGYGHIARSPNLVESWIDIQGNNGDAHDVDDGADTIGRQYINARFDFGWGPLRSWQNMQLNGKDIGEFQDIAFVVIDGSGPQTPVTAYDSRWTVLNRTTTGTTTNTTPTTDFTSSHNNYPVNQRVRAGTGTSFTYYGQSDDTDELTVFMTMPQGCWRYDDNMVIKRLAISYDVFYRVSGSGEGGWVHVAGNGTPNGETHYYYNIRQTILRQATIIPVARGKYDVKVVKRGSGAVHNPLDYFEHESNMFGDELWVESVQEMTRTTLLYPRMIQVLMRIMATDQISGGDLQLSMEITHGLTVALTGTLYGLPEDCHAAVAYDMHTEPTYGGGLPDIDLPFLKEWAALTQTQVPNGEGGTQRLASFNGVFDREDENLWAALNSVGVAGYANLQRIGKTTTGWLDADDVPVQAFHVASTTLNSYKKVYLNLDDRAQQVEITAAFAADQYKTSNPLRLLSGAQTGAVDRKKSSVNLRGCTDKVEAYYWGTRRLQESEQTIRTHTWDSTIKALRCRTGNVVKLQYNLPGAGYGGYLRPGSSDTVLYTDQVLPFLGNSYVTVLFPVLLQFSGNVSSIPVGLRAHIDGYDGVTPVQRFVQNGIDVAITGYGPGYVDVADEAGLTAGYAELWALDVLVERPILYIAFGTDSMTFVLQSPLPAVPPENAAYFYEKPGVTEAKLVRVKQITKRVGEQRVTITATDYISPQVPPPAPGLVFVGTAVSSSSPSGTGGSSGSSGGSSGGSGSGSSGGSTGGSSGGSSGGSTGGGRTGTGAEQQPL